MAGTYHAGDELVAMAVDGGTVVMKINREGVTAVVSRVWQRPLPAILNYTVSLVSALLLAPMLTWALRSAFRRPLLASAINARSLDLLLDAFSAMVEGATPLPTVIALVLLPLAFLLFWVLRMVVEGMALHSYDSEESVPFRKLLRAGGRWVLPFFGQGLISFGVYVVCVVIPALVPLATNFIGGGVARAINIIVVMFFALIICLWSILAEIARANAIVDNEGNIAVCLWEAVGIVRKIPMPVMALHGTSAAASLLLTALTLWLNRAVPVQWWLLGLVLLQVLALLRVAIRFSRWAGNVALVQACLPPLQSSSDIS